MGYLEPAEYAAFGLNEDTAEAVTAASAMVEAFCRRLSLMATSYTERLRVRRGAGAVRVSYAPLISVEAAKVRYARLRREEDGGLSGFGSGLPGEIAGAFGLSGAWVALDASALGFDAGSDEVRLAVNELAPRTSEVELTYTAGFAQVPDAVKVACAQIVRNAQATPGLNVKSSRMDTLQMEYFRDSLVDSQVRALLRPYIAERLG